MFARITKDLDHVISGLKKIAFMTFDYSYNSHNYHLTILDGSTVIPDTAFQKYYTDFPIASLALPNSLTAIGKDAFEGNHLRVVVISDSVIIIGDSAFRDNLLTKVTIPDSVVTIGDGAFASNDLRNVNIPKSLTIIAASAFGYELKSGGD